MILKRWQFGKRGALAISPRWQFMAGALAIFAALLGCSPGWVVSSPTPSPVPSPARAATAEPLQQEKPQVSQAPAAGGKETVSAYQSLNVRRSSSEKSESLGILYHGDPVRVTGICRGIWAEIRYIHKGETVSAWVNSRYITGDRCEEE
jgi:uncharacterized protein YgiM (DUF1202 family)